MHSSCIPTCMCIMRSPAWLPCSILDKLSIPRTEFLGYLSKPSMISWISEVNYACIDAWICMNRMGITVIAKLHMLIGLPLTECSLWILLPSRFIVHEPISRIFHFFKNCYAWEDAKLISLIWNDFGGDETRLEDRLPIIKICLFKIF